MRRTISALFNRIAGGLCRCFRPEWIVLHLEPDLRFQPAHILEQRPYVISTGMDRISCVWEVTAEESPGLRRVYELMR